MVQIVHWLGGSNWSRLSMGLRWPGLPVCSGRSRWSGGPGGPGGPSGPGCHCGPGGLHGLNNQIIEKT